MQAAAVTAAAAAAAAATVAAKNGAASGYEVTVLPHNGDYFAVAVATIDVIAAAAGGKLAAAEVFAGLRRSHFLTQ